MSFDALLDDVMTDAERFGHREHLHLTWLAVRRYGVPGATELISDGIRRVGGARYHATVTRAWVELVGSDFDTFLRGHPALLDQDLLLRYYSPEALATGRDRWVAPDKAPLP
ncbi:hypothetical protein [Cryptosporangium arvum]|uniref:hypothetical protein n=1 Tax=Cryptosporangium arvum TaxID=80871 RepID=UPI0004BCC4A9|nr:hypothetical protein [Cryptosporangium arvum]